MLDLEPVPGPLGVRSPGLGDALVQPVRSPVLGALAEAIRGEEEDGLRPGELGAAAEVLAVGDADGSVVLELIFVVPVDCASDLGVPRHVDIYRRVAVQRLQLLIGHDLVVDPERLGELDVPRRGQPDHLDAIALVEQVREGGGGAARGGGEHRRPGPEEVRVIEEVVDQERGEVERPEQHLLVLVSLLVEGQAGDPHVAVVGGRELRPVRRRVDEVERVGAVRLHDEVGSWRQVPEDPRPLRHSVRLAGYHVGEAPDRHPRPAVLIDREELPVVHRLAHHRVGDVVGGEAEGVDTEQHLTVLELRRVGVGEARFVKVVFPDLEVDARSLFSERSGARSAL
jgi:hypothetical protein